MGNIRLGQLPRPRKWNQIVELIRVASGCPMVDKRNLHHLRVLDEEDRDDALAGWVP